MESMKIPKTLTRRLPGYLEYLKALPGDDRNISATAIAEALGLGAVQVRKDLAKVSKEGRCRTGRSRDRLIRDIEQYLECAYTNGAVIVGSGALDWEWLEEQGLNIMACFDLRPPEKRQIRGTPVYTISRLPLFCKHYDVRIGIVAVSPAEAQGVCDGLIACGVREIRNLTESALRVPENVILRGEAGAAKEQ